MFLSTENLSLLIFFIIKENIHINFTCNVLYNIFVIRYEIMFITSLRVHVSGWGGGVNESMDGRGCAILALELVPNNLIFA